MAYQHYPHFQPGPPAPGGYGAPPAFGPQPPFAAPAPQMDPFRAWYSSRLRELTFNSRPIIQDLSIHAMAQRDQNNWVNMQAVVEEIEAAVLRAGPQAKLPLLYLLDSISKNVGPPYTDQLLPPIIPRLYIKTYREVDGVTKSKMEEMIRLWRTGAPNGGDLYGAAAREAVERELFGSLPPASYAGPSREQVTGAIRRLLDQKHRESAQRPWDDVPRKHVAALMQLDGLVQSTQLQPNELVEIMNKLNAMSGLGTTSTAPPGNSHPNAYATSPPSASQPYGQAPPGSLPGLPPFPPHNAHSSYPPQQAPAPMAPVRSPVPTSLPTVAAPTPLPVAPSTSNLPLDVAALLRNINGANFAALSSQPMTPERSSGPEKATSALDTYEELVLSLDVRLDSLDTNTLHMLPLAHLTTRCNQCGTRFVVSEEDPLFKEHLDWHFRRNHQEGQAGGRGAHRRWLPRAETWINEVASAEAGPSIPTDAKPSLSTTITIDRAKLEKRWIPAPRDPVTANRPCPICKEQFKSEWSEDDEEWVWKNAVAVKRNQQDPDPLIFHATCRAEQQAAKKRLGDTHRRSKSGSPLMTPQPLEGVKVEPSHSKLAGSPAPSLVGSVASALDDDAVEREVADETGAVEPPKSENAHVPADDAGQGIKRKAEDELDKAEEEGKKVKVEAVEEKDVPTIAVTDADEGSTPALMRTDAEAA